MFDRKELLQSKEYWLTRIQAKLYSLLEDYMVENKLNRTKLADKLGVSKGYISQILNGNFDHRLSKFIELSLAINKVPKINFEDFDQVLKDDEMGLLYEDENMKRPIINLEINFKPSEQNLNYGQHRSYGENDSKIVNTSYFTTLKGAKISKSEEFLS
ncbi:MAG: helix-turn-helix transcriptional regulator [Candidatus Paceibacterota bacterium]